ncbi:MAG: hypothetical protein WD184_05290 [Acidimicrobiia bacterium]
MEALSRGATFGEVRIALVDWARDLERAADFEGSFSEKKWEGVRADATQYVHNVVDVLKEGVRLGWIEKPSQSLPSTPRSAYLHLADRFNLRPAGEQWVALLRANRRAAYDHLVGLLLDVHPQFEGFLRAVGAREDSTAPSMTVPLLRWDRHEHEAVYLDNLISVTQAAVAAGSVGWSVPPSRIEESIRSYVTRIAQRREARGKPQTRRGFLKTCEEAATKCAFAGAGVRLDYVSMELLRRWTKFLGLADFTYHAPEPYALRFWATSSVLSAGVGTAIARRVGSEIRGGVLRATIEAWNERRSLPGAAMYAPVWELRAAVCWRMRISDTEWDKAISELVHGGHADVGYKIHLDRASLGAVPGSTRPLVIPTAAGQLRVYNVMTVVADQKEKK